MKLVLYTLGVAAAAAGSTTPEQVHIALAGQDVNGDATGFSFAWFTEDLTTASSVEYTVANASASNVVNGTASQYLEGYGYHHVAKVFGIPADTSVTYRVGSSDGGWSENFTATTPPPKDVERTVKLSVFGDMGYADSNLRPMAVAAGGLVKNWSATFSRQVLERLKDNGEIDAVWHLGDIGYADDAFGHDPLKFLYEEAYNGYMNWLQNLTAALPYMVLPGNHESECHSPYVLGDEKLAKQLANFSAYNTRWAMPSEESHGSFETNMWYSFNYGPVHFVSSNTETDFKGAGEEHTGDGHFPWLKAGGFGADGEYQAWLEADLKAASEARANGTGRRWLVVGGHRNYNEVPQFALDLFNQYGVDMYMCGHGHSYLRSVPASQHTIETHHDPKHIKGAQAPVWVMVGGAGCEEMAQGVTHAPGFAAPAGSETVASHRYATGVLEANQTALYWRVIDSVTGALIDEVTITR